MNPLRLATGGVMGLLLLCVGSVALGAEPSVVINEVMWMGSVGNGDDEWVELYNPSETAIDVTGWELQGAGSSDSSVGISGIIDAKSFYLLSRYDTAGSALADSIVTHKLPSISLKNNDSRGGGERLTLVDTYKKAVDSTPVAPWPAGEDKTTSRKSMERNDQAKGGDDPANWHTCIAEKCRGLEFWDQVGDNYGTPGGKNSGLDEPVPPNVALTVPETAYVGQEILFSAEDSTNPDGEQLVFTWDFGDGKTGEGVETKHTYQKSGEYSVVLQATDGRDKATTDRTIIIEESNFSSDVLINEFLSNPSGEEAEREFIELKNFSSEEISLEGWKLTDSITKSTSGYVFPAKTVLLPGGLLVAKRSLTKITLNNSNDAVYLFDPAGKVKSSFVYQESVSEDQSYNLAAHGDYELSTTLTPGEENIITKPVDDEEDESETKITTKKTPRPTPTVAGSRNKAVFLADILKQKDGTLITTEGVVSASPSLLGKNVLYIGEPGIQAYLSKGNYPTLSLGDRVGINGIVTHRYGELCIKIQKPIDVYIKGKDTPAQPREIKTGEAVKSIGSLVSISGKVAENQSDGFVIDDGTGAVRVVIKESTGIKKPRLAKGSFIKVKGVVSTYNGNVRLLPRFQTDIEAAVPAPKTKTSISKAGKSAATHCECPSVPASTSVCASSAVDSACAPCPKVENCSRCWFGSAGMLIVLVVAQLLVLAWRANEPLLFR